MGVVRPDSLASRVVQAVRELGQATTQQIVARVGLSVPQSTAVRYGETDVKVNATKRGYAVNPRTLEMASLTRRGRSRAVRAGIMHAKLQGRIVRVARDLYALPEDAT